MFTDDACTTLVGRLFDVLTTRWLKKELSGIESGPLFSQLSLVSSQDVTSGC